MRAISSWIMLSPWYAHNQKLSVNCSTVLFFFSQRNIIFIIGFNKGENPAEFYNAYFSMERHVAFYLEVLQSFLSFVCSLVLLCRFLCS